MSRHTLFTSGASVYLVPGGWRAQTAWGRKSPVFALRVDACAWLTEAANPKKEAQCSRKP